MKLRYIVFIVSLCSMNMAWSHEFCGKAKFVPFDALFKNKETYLDKRVKTEAIWRTDGMHFTFISSKEHANGQALSAVMIDKETLRYRKEHSLPLDDSFFEVKKDFLKNLREKEGINYKPDMSYISYYRQIRMLCGRIEKPFPSEDKYYFITDDWILEKSYLLDWNK